VSRGGAEECAQTKKEERRGAFLKGRLAPILTPIWGFLHGIAIRRKEPEYLQFPFGFTGGGPKDRGSTTCQGGNWKNPFSKGVRRSTKHSRGELTVAWSPDPITLLLIRVGKKESTRGPQAQHVLLVKGRKRGGITVDSTAEALES